MQIIRWALTLFFLVIFNPSLALVQNDQIQTLSKDIHWQQYSTSMLNEVKPKHFILIFGKASWCEWCKKTESITFKDPAVIKLINDNYLPLMLDIDKDRVAAKNYKMIKLPTLLILDNQRKVIKEMNGYIAPQDLIKTLGQLNPDNQKIVKSSLANPEEASAADKETILPSETQKLLNEKLLLWLAKMDAEGGGISSDKKYISRFSMQYAAGLAKAGNEIAIHWITTTLDNGEKLVDPIWGGMYNYSTQGDWVHPNFEKSLTAQALNIRVYINAYMLTGDRGYYLVAEKVMNYMLNFLMSADGGFYNGQAAKMKNGKADESYYLLNDRLRQANGIPLVDKTIYASSCGEGIEALATMYMITGEKRYLDQAIKSAEWAYNHLVLKEGGFKHTETDVGELYLKDSLKMSKALLSLYMATSDKKYLSRSEGAMEFIGKHFRSSTGDGYLSYFSTSKAKPLMLQDGNANNANLARQAALLYAYDHNKSYIEISRQSLHYLADPKRVTSISPSMVLIADHAVNSEPLKVTIIGQRDSLDAFSLFSRALSFPSYWKIIEWYETLEEAQRLSGQNYMPSSLPVAYICVEGRCSLPLYKPTDFDSITNHMLIKQERFQDTSIVSSVVSGLPKFSSTHVQQLFANILIHRDWVLIFLCFWCFGLLLAFTPCVFPLLIVLSTLLASFGSNVSRARKFSLSLTYALSLAFTYALMGGLMGWLGSTLQAYLQSVVVISLFSIMLIALSFSLLGGYTIKLPIFIRRYLVGLNSFHASNTYLGAALMGMVMTLIAAPCAAAPIIGVLSFVTEMGDPLLGAIALFSMGLGVGAVLIVSSLASDAILHKLHDSREFMKTVCGLLLLALGIWFSSRVVSQWFYMLLVSALVIITALYLGVIKKTTIGVFGKFKKTLSIMLIVYGISILIGAIIGNADPFKPLNRAICQDVQPAALGIFQTVKTEKELSSLLNLAQQQARPVILDFYASWCDSCKVIDRDIFTNPEVSSVMLEFVLLRVDLTKGDYDIAAIASKYRVISPPVILFFNRQGKELETSFVGSINKDEFLEALKKISTNK